MLLSPNSSIVFFCCFEQLEMAITRRRAASLTERLHLLRRHRFEAARNSHVLVQHVQRVDTANCGRDRETHRITKRFFRPHDAILGRLAVAPEALHAERCNPPPLKFREHLLLEAAIGCIKTVEGHLDSVEWVILRQHFEMYRRTLMSGETNKTYLALLFRFIQRFDRAALCEMQVRVVLVDDLVNLP